MSCRCPSTSVSALGPATIGESGRPAQHHGGGVDFEYSDVQVEYCRQVEKFARDRLCDDLLARDRSMTFGRDLWRALGEFGFLGLPVPTHLGGSGADALTA